MSILVAGSLHLDVVVRAPDLPRLDETVTGSGVAYVFGGKGGNQAVAAARMGADVSFAGRAGSDRFGDMLRDTLDDAGVDRAQLQCDSGASGMSTAIVTATGEYGAVIVSAANLAIEAEQIVIPKGTRLVLLQNEIPQDVNTVVARRAKAAGAQVWLNAAPARALPPEFLAMVDLMIVNRVEAAFYADQSGGVDLLTTLGPEGVTYGNHRYPGQTVQVVSTHGAGDMFVGALAARVVAGQTMSQAIDAAQSAAAWYITLGAEARARPETYAQYLRAGSAP